MKLERAKEMAGDILNTGQALFKRDGCLYTVLFSIDGNERVTPVSVSLEEQNNMELISDLIKDLVGSSEAIIVLMDTHFKWFEKGEKVHYVIKDDPDSDSALSVIVHVKNGQSSMRQLIYVKDGDSIMFSSEPWHDSKNLGGALGKNPF
jgi:hypothetical protein